MKAAIITLYDNYNYGNKLQNYALQEALGRLDVDSVTLKNEVMNVQYTIEDAKLSSGFPRMFPSYLKRKLIQCGIIRYRIACPDAKRRANIARFDQLIKTTDLRISKSTLKNLMNDVDFFVLGSDQVWNPGFILNYRFSLAMDIPENKKITYAISLGIDGLLDRHKQIYRESLRSFKKGTLSFREERARNYFKNEFNVDSEVVLDPTMLLTRGDWLKLSRSPDNLPKGKFILAYFLGDNASNRDKAVENYARENNYILINLLDDNNEEYTSGVEEFLWYINNAELVLSDSFHAGVFSIIFNTPFYILSRSGTKMNMNSRFTTLLTTFDLNDRYIELDFGGEINYDIDFSKTNEILHRKRLKSYKYLEHAIKCLLP